MAGLYDTDGDDETAFWRLDAPDPDTRPRTGDKRRRGERHDDGKPHARGSKRAPEPDREEHKGRKDRDRGRGDRPRRNPDMDVEDPLVDDAPAGGDLWSQSDLLDADGALSAPPKRRIRVGRILLLIIVIPVILFVGAAGVSAVVDTMHARTLQASVSRLDADITALRKANRRLTAITGDKTTAGLLDSKLKTQAIARETANRRILDEATPARNSGDTRRIDTLAGKAGDALAPTRKLASTLEARTEKARLAKAKTGLENSVKTGRELVKGTGVDDHTRDALDTLNRTLDDAATILEDTTSTVDTFDEAKSRVDKAIDQVKAKAEESRKAQEEQARKDAEAKAQADAQAQAEAEARRKAAATPRRSTTRRSTGGTTRRPSGGSSSGGGTTYTPAPTPAPAPAPTPSPSPAPTTPKQDNSGVTIG
ncbi:hypothetical protein CSQ85_09105 [Bifidobacterium rousetti]|uniref:hypothetical protein n=1 Tax=Bifidobacterium rousetti TaxID=2045439 RepID=UPI00123B3772|nr:hypothetical protein [Bifidobacterium rousetti]KAA8818309.1 hypothetical protein CSQ85_09105 [Bifidobacterium rousetti]